MTEKQFNTLLAVMISGVIVITGLSVNGAFT